MNGEDFAEFMHADEFAVSATLETGETIAGIFTDEATEGGDREGLEFVTPTENVRAYGLTHGRQLTIFSERQQALILFEINGRQDDGTGITTILLSEV